MKTVTVAFSCDEWLLPTLLKLLRAMNHLHHAGKSRTVSFYCDGDGHSPLASYVSISDGSAVQMNGTLIRLTDSPESEGWEDLIRG